MRVAVVGVLLVAGCTTTTVEPSTTTTVEPSTTTTVEPSTTATTKDAEAYFAEAYFMEYVEGPYLDELDDELDLFVDDIESVLRMTSCEDLVIEVVATLATNGQLRAEEEWALVAFGRARLAAVIDRMEALGCGDATTFVDDIESVLRMTSCEDLVIESVATLGQLRAEEEWALVAFGRARLAVVIDRMETLGCD